MVRVSLVFLCFYFFLIFFLVGSLDSSVKEIGVPSMHSTSSSVSGLEMNLTLRTISGKYSLSEKWNLTLSDLRESPGTAKTPSVSMFIKWA